MGIAELVCSLGEVPDIDRIETDLELWKQDSDLHPMAPARKAQCGAVLASGGREVFISMPRFAEENPAWEAFCRNKPPLDSRCPDNPREAPRLRAFDRNRLITDSATPRNNRDMGGET